MRPRVGPHYPRRYAPAHSTCAGALIGARLCINAQTPGSSRENSSHAVPTPRDTVADSVTISRVTQREKRGQISPAIERGGGRGMGRRATKRIRPGSGISNESVVVSTTRSGYDMTAMAGRENFPQLAERARSRATINFLPKLADYARNASRRVTLRWTRRGAGRSMILWRRRPKCHVRNDACTTKWRTRTINRT